MASAILATYPARRRFVPNTVASLIPQVDQVIVVANEFGVGDLEAGLPLGVQVIVPPEDYKDEGKFCHTFGPDDDVLLCDDDIIYPPDYFERMKQEYDRYAALRPIIGVHGVVYSDFFDGKPESRVVHVFTEALGRTELVNQLGTGTVFCRGRQLPPFAFMRGSARFVDLRFAIHCHRNNYPRICIAREKNWMVDQDTGSSLFTSFTQRWPDHVTREAQEISGLRFLPGLDVLSRNLVDRI